MYILVWQQENVSLLDVCNVLNNREMRCSASKKVLRQAAQSLWVKMKITILSCNLSLAHWQTLAIAFKVGQPSVGVLKVVHSVLVDHFEYQFVWLSICLISLTHVVSSLSDNLLLHLFHLQTDYGSLLRRNTIWLSDSLFNSLSNSCQKSVQWVQSQQLDFELLCVYSSFHV